MRNNMKIDIYPVDEKYGGEYMEKCIGLADSDIPEWYKKSRGYMNESKFKNLSPHEKQTIKRCIPVFDYLTTGINLYLPFTIYVNGKYPERTFNCNTVEPDICGLGGHLSEQVQDFPLPLEYDPRPKKINFPYVIKAPRGYSAIYVQPINELSDTLLFPRGLINVDKWNTQVNFPFFIKKDFEGYINAESHFMTVFFVKREKLSLNFNDHKKSNGFIEQSNTMVQNWGKNFYRDNRF